MSEDENALFMAHLRSIRTAIVGLALAVVAAGLIISGGEDPLDFFFLSTLICRSQYLGFSRTNGLC